MVFKCCVGYIEDNTERFITSVCTFMACAFSCFTHVTHTRVWFWYWAQSACEALAKTKKQAAARACWTGHKPQVQEPSSELHPTFPAHLRGNPVLAAPELSSPKPCAAAAAPEPWGARLGLRDVAGRLQRPAASLSLQPEEERAKGPCGAPRAENPSLVTENEGKEKAVRGSLCFSVSSLC